jgi:hypothetical protein
MPRSSAVAAVFLVGLACLAESSPLAQERTLASGVVVADELRGGAPHEYRIVARAGEAIDVRVTQLGIDLMVAVLDPNGAVLQDIDSPTGPEGDEKTTVLAAADGTLSRWTPRVRSGWRRQI